MAQIGQFQTHLQGEESADLQSLPGLCYAASWPRSRSFAMCTDHLPAVKRGPRRTNPGKPPGGRPMYIFLDAITFQYRGAPAPALDRLSLFVRSGEIAAVVGPAAAGKTTLLRYVGRRSDGSGGVFLGGCGSFASADQRGPGGAASGMARAT